MTVEELKAALKMNDCVYSAMTKSELKKRVAFNAVNGCVGRCPKCGGGKLKRCHKNVVFCPGSYDDDEFVSCDFVSRIDDIQVVPWKTKDDEVI